MRPDPWAFSLLRRVGSIVTSYTLCASQIPEAGDATGGDRHNRGGPIFGACPIQQVTRGFAGKVRKSRKYFLKFQWHTSC